MNWAEIIGAIVGAALPLLAMRTKAGEPLRSRTREVRERLREEARRKGKL